MKMFILTLILGMQSFNLLATTIHLQAGNEVSINPQDGDIKVVCRGNAVRANCALKNYRGLVELHQNNEMVEKFLTIDEAMTAYERMKAIGLCN
jgi:hypothetical protein